MSVDPLKKSSKIDFEIIKVNTKMNIPKTRFAVLIPFFERAA